MSVQSLFESRLSRARMMTRWSAWHFIDSRLSPRYEKAVIAMAKQSVTLEVLSYHASASLEDAQRLKVGTLLTLFQRSGFTVDGCATRRFSPL